MTIDSLSRHTVKEYKRTKQQMFKMLHDSIRKKNRNIYDFTPKKMNNASVYGRTGMSEEQLTNELIKYSSGHGASKDNHAVIEMISNSLQKYPKLKNLYLHGHSH